MDVNLIAVQRCTIEAYNNLILLLNKSPKDEDKIEVNIEKLDSVLTDLHNELTFVGALLNKNGVCYLDGERKYIMELDTERV